MFGVRKEKTASLYEACLKFVKGLFAAFIKTRSEDSSQPTPTIKTKECSIPASIWCDVDWKYQKFSCYPVSVRQTLQILNLRSSSSYNFYWFSGFVSWKLSFYCNLLRIPIQSTARHANLKWIEANEAHDEACKWRWIECREAEIAACCHATCVRERRATSDRRRRPLYQRLSSICGWKFSLVGIFLDSRNDTRKYMQNHSLD